MTKTTQFRAAVLLAAVLVMPGLVQANSTTSAYAAGGTNIWGFSQVASIDLGAGGDLVWDVSFDGLQPGTVFFGESVLWEDWAWTLNLQVNALGNNLASDATPTGSFFDIQAFDEGDMTFSEFASIFFEVEPTSYPGFEVDPELLGEPEGDAIEFRLQFVDGFASVFNIPGSPGFDDETLLFQPFANFELAQQFQNDMSIGVGFLRWGDGEEFDPEQITEIVIFGSVTALNVDVVPLPAAIWLFGSALGLLGWLRSRKG